MARREYEEFTHRCWYEMYYGAEILILPGHPSVKVMTTHTGGHVRILTDKGKIVAGRKVE
jgi:hypothetical protein